MNRKNNSIFDEVMKLIIDGYEDEKNIKFSSTTYNVKYNTVDPLNTKKFESNCYYELS